MVGVLWAPGQRDRAMLLEVYWNRRNGLPGFNLLCGYPIEVWSEEIASSAAEAILSQHTRLASTGWREDLESALDRAVAEGLDPHASAAAAPKTYAEDASTEMPHAEATILWLWAAAPDQAAQILTRARQYFTELRSAGSPAPAGALKPFFDRLSSRERDALTRFYVRGESPSKIHAATGIRESELRQLRLRARAFYRETQH
jgi:DNA-directed RNA polymerase specialized sigma24 family protein